MYSGIPQCPGIQADLAEPAAEPLPAAAPADDDEDMVP